MKIFRIIAYVTTEIAFLSGLAANVLICLWNIRTYYDIRNVDITRWLNLYLLLGLHIYSMGSFYSLHLLDILFYLFKLEFIAKLKDIDVDMQ